MQLAIDRGNTQTKISGEMCGELVDFTVIDDAHLDAALNAFIVKHRPQQAILADVRKSDETEKLIASIPIPCLRLDASLRLPFSISYSTADTLGQDRLANAAGAVKRFGNKTMVVIDVGTCMTYTFLENKTLIGGSISPGIQLRFRALHQFTGRLPLLSMETDELPDLTGRSTTASIISGIIRGIIAETEGMIENYRLLHPEIMVIITGGYTSFFEKHLKSSIFAAPQLTQEGLHEILRFHCA